MNNFFLSIVILGSCIAQAQVGIGTTTPNAAAALDITSTTQGLLPPRMTAAQRDAIATPVQGLTIFNTDHKCLNVYVGYWRSLCAFDNTDSTGTITHNSLTYEDIYSAATGLIWLDRNLGATQVATSSTDGLAYGNLYQWGRGTDGHQISTSPTRSARSGTDDPGHGDFIITTTSPRYWRSPEIVNLWQGANGVNNPCPSGYRLPTEAEWDAERVSWVSNNAAGALASPLKLPKAGFRYHEDGSLRAFGGKGSYWSSTIKASPHFSGYLNFDDNNSNAGDYYRASGFSVRCLKD
ncbi:FISUMP domain-containing protein [Nonlabens sp.]|uniref:FISUMP domain-containing protein n=1 Tax=Nonlabens sp. TaxID=1888209 RepID=UPI001BCD258E|nr:FISUMP domain-containing protein [Nonlabens sp.]